MIKSGEWYKTWFLQSNTHTHEDKHRSCCVWFLLFRYIGIFGSFLIHEAKVMNLRWELLTHPWWSFFDDMPSLHSFLRYFWVLQCCWEPCISWSQCVLQWVRKMTWNQLEVHFLLGASFGYLTWNMTMLYVWIIRLYRLI